MRFNEIQFIGSHNSYKKAIDHELLAQLAEANPGQALALDYSHPPLGRQLDLGLRKLELDIFYDPQGGRYANPLGLHQVSSPTPFTEADMMAPGFKTFHVQDIDFRSQCLLFEQCLAGIVAWSNAHPRHIPILITINAKDGVIDVPGFTQPLPFDAEAFKALDAVIKKKLAGKLFTPDDLRQGKTDLREAVREGWPLLSEMTGKILVVLDEGGEKLATYVTGAPGLEGRAMFANASEATPEAAIRIVNNPIDDFDYIQQLVRQGFLVRTRSDANTLEARNNDTARRDRAFASGAQIVSTDYYQPDKRLSDFSVALPGGAAVRCNPLLRPAGCNLAAYNQRSK